MKKETIVLTGEEIDDKGAKVLSDGLKVNTTLTSLIMTCEEEQQIKKLNNKMMIKYQGMILELKEQKQ